MNTPTQTEINNARLPYRQIERIVNDTWRSMAGSECRAINRAVYDAVIGAGYAELTARAAVAQSNAIACGAVPQFSFYGYFWRIERIVEGDVENELARTVADIRG